jgi:hypothetical protein
LEILAISYYNIKRKINGTDHVVEKGLKANGYLELFTSQTTLKEPIERGTALD